MRMKEAHIVRRMLDVDIPMKRKRGRPNLRWTYACKRDMKQDNMTKRVSWRETITSPTGEPRNGTGPEQRRSKLGGV